MQESYPVLLENVNVGEARIIKEGLYYSISCRCNLSNDTGYRLYICNDIVEMDLGILIPEQGGYVVRTKIAAKRLPHDGFKFCVLSPGHVSSEDRIAINPAEPFPCLSQLEQLRLTRWLDGFYAIYTKEKSQSSETT